MGGIISKFISMEQDLTGELKEVIKNLNDEIIDKQNSWQSDTSPKTPYNTKAHEYYITCLEKRIQLYQKIQKSNKLQLSDVQLSWVKDITALLNNLYTTPANSYLAKISIQEDLKDLKDLEEANEVDKKILLLRQESCELSIKHSEYHLAHLSDRLLNSLYETKCNFSMAEILREAMLYTSAQNAVLHLTKSLKSTEQSMPKDLSNIMLQKLKMHFARCELNNFTGEEQVPKHEQLIEQYNNLITRYEKFHNDTYVNAQPSPSHFFIEQEPFNQIIIINASFNKAKIFDLDSTIKQLDASLILKPKLN